MCNFRNQWQISSLSIACVFRSTAAFSAILTLAGGLFHASTLSNVLQRHKSTGETFQTVWTNRRFGLKIVFLGDSIKPVKSEIMAYLNHCSVKRNIVWLIQGRGGGGGDDFSNWGSFWGNTSWMSQLTHCPTTGLRWAQMCTTVWPSTGTAHQSRTSQQRAPHVWREIPLGWK